MFRKSFRKGAICAFLCMLMSVSLCPGIGVFAADKIQVSTFKWGGEGNNLSNAPIEGWGHDQLTYFANGQSRVAQAKDNFVAKCEQNQDGSVGRAVYCIELGEAINWHEFQTRASDDYWSNISSNGVLSGQEQEQMIGRILAYGYQGVLPTLISGNENNVANYLATQILVWETICGERDSNFDLHNPPQGCNSVLQMISESHPLRSLIYENYGRIIDSVHGNFAIPSFCSSVESNAGDFTLKYSQATGDYRTTVVDSNHLLYAYTDSITSNNSNINFDYNHSSNEFTISSDLPIEESAIVELGRSISSYALINEFYTWADPEVQDVVSLGENHSEDKSSFIRVHTQEITLGSLSIIKSGLSCTGVLMDTELGFEVNRPIFENTPLEGAQYSVFAESYTYDGQGIQYEPDEFVGTLTTDSSGNSNTISGLGFGTYYIVETVAPEGYDNDTQIYNVVLELEEISSVIESHVIPVNDIRHQVSFSFLKNQEEVNEAFNYDYQQYADLMNEVVFGIYTNESIEFGTTSIPANTLIDVASATCESDSTDFLNGRVVFDTQLPYGSYYCIELSSNSIYQISSDKNFFEVTSSSIGNITVNVGDPVTNELGQILGLKTDSSDNPVCNAVIGLYNSIDLDTLIMSATSGENGEFFFEGIPLGTYYVAEIEAPVGYTLSEEIFEVALIRESPTQNIVIVDNIVVNEPPIGVSPTPEVTPSITPNDGTTPTEQVTAPPSVITPTPTNMQSIPSTGERVKLQVNLCKFGILLSIVGIILEIRRHTH